MMDLKKFDLLEELRCLSQKSDEIIETEISKTRIYDEFFEEAKNRIYEILNSKFSKKEICQINQDAYKNANFRLGKTLSPIIDPKVRIHLKSKNKNLSAISEDGEDVSTCNTKPTPSISMNERINNNVLDIFDNNSYSDSNGNHIYQEEMNICCKNQEMVESESGGRESLVSSTAKRLKLGEFTEKECESSNKFSESCSSFNINNINLGDMNIVPGINMQEIFQEPQVLNGPNNQNEVDNKQKKTITSSQKSKKYKKIGVTSPRVTRSKSRCENKMSISSNESRNSSEKLSDISDVKNSSNAIFDETYVVNSDSGSSSNRHDKNGVVFKTPISNKISDPSVIDSSRNSKWSENTTRNTKELVRQSGNLDEKEVLTLTEKFPVQMPVEGTTEGINLWCFCSPRTKMKSASKNKKCFFSRRKQKSTRESDTKQNPSEVPTKREPSGIITDTSISEYRLRSLDKQTTGRKSSETIMSNPKDDQKLRKLVLIKRNNEKLLSDAKTYKSRLTYTKKGAEKHLCASDKSEGDKNGNNFQQTICEHSNNFETGPLECFDGRNNSSEKRVKEARKESVKHEKRSRQCRTQSVPVLKRKRVNSDRNITPVNPIEFSSNFNRQSLKVKACEKRKLREIREQEIKKRKECLEKERLERIHILEQKRKQRFQRHEEMLKKNIENLKIKSRSMQQSIYKRITLSSSSEDGKENTAKSNDDCKRNSSGQKLSGESKSYHDVPSKKVLESKTELYPEVATKQNTILPSREKRLLEISNSGSSRRTKKSKKMSVGHYEAVNFQTCAAESVEKVVKPLRKLTPSKCKPSHYFETKMIFPEQNTISIKMPLKRKTATYTSKHCKAEKLTKYDHVRVFSEKNAVRTQKYSSCLLRSHKKGSKKTYNEEIMNLPDFIKYDKNAKNSQPLRDSFKCSTQTITACSSKESADCGKTCFNIKFCKSQKSDKNLLTPPNQNINLHGENCMQTRSMERLLKGSNVENSACKAESNKANETRKKEGLTSYRISDFNEDSSDEVKVDPKKIPLWATGVYLKQALIQQYFKPPKSVEEIFGVLPNEPVDLTVIFGRNKPEYHNRTSSGEWSSS